MPGPSPSPTAELKAALADRFRETGMLTKALLDAQAALDQEKAAHADTHRRLESAEFASQSYNEIVQSTSWKITRPLRRAVGALRR